MEFLEPARLWYLSGLLIALAAVYLGYLRRNRGIENYGKKESLEITGKILPKIRKLLPELLLVSAIIIFSVAGLADPQRSVNTAANMSENTAGFIILDISRSMTAPDILPDRISAAKEEISRFMDEFNANRGIGGRLGLIVFANHAIRISNLTFDIDSLQLSLKYISTKIFDYYREQGTNIPAALNLAQDLFTEYEKDNKKKLDKKFIILLSDGEISKTHAGDLDSVLNKCEEQKIPVYTIGVGKYERVDYPAVDSSEDNSELWTSFTPNTLIKIKNSTGGRYFPYKKRGELTALLKKILKDSGAAKKEITERRSLAFVSDGLAAFFIALWILRQKYLRN